MILRKKRISSKSKRSKDNFSFKSIQRKCRVWIKWWPKVTWLLKMSLNWLNRLSKNNLNKRKSITRPSKPSMYLWFKTWHQIRNLFKRRLIRFKKRVSNRSLPNNKSKEQLLLRWTMKWVLLSPNLRALRKNLIEMKRESSSSRRWLMIVKLILVNFQNKYKVKKMKKSNFKRISRISLRSFLMLNSSRKNLN